MCLFEGPFVRTFVRMFISKRMHLSVCERTFMCMHLWTSRTKACLHTCIRTYIHTNIQTAARVYTHVCTHTRTHASLHTYKHRMYKLEKSGMFILYIHTYIYTNVRVHKDRRTGITFMPRTVFFLKLRKQCRPRWNATIVVFHQGIRCLPTHPITNSLSKQFRPRSGLIEQWCACSTFFEKGQFRKKSADDNRYIKITQHAKN